MTDHIAQVGGDHYEAEDGIQHWDIMEKHDVAYLEATATKYVTRYDRKGKPVEDLDKAESYLRRMLQSRKAVRRTVPNRDLQRFFVGNGLSVGKRDVIDAILAEGQGTEAHINHAISVLNRLRAEAG